MTGYRGKAISITYSGRVFAALVIQHVKCIRRIVLVTCDLSGSTTSCHDFRGKVIENEMCVWTFSATFV